MLAAIQPMKKLLWTALAAAVSAAAASGAMRLLRYMWRKSTHEEPPEQPRWAQLLVGKPLKAGAPKSHRGRYACVASAVLGGVVR